MLRVRRTEGTYVSPIYRGDAQTCIVNVLHKQICILTAHPSSSAAVKNFVAARLSLTDTIIYFAVGFRPS